MKKQILAAGVICASLFAITAKTNDPVLMNVAGKDVRLSEFEYLYNKNNAQQVQPQTLDEYVDMFVNFKLKVAAAEAEGIDTTDTFMGEYLKFRNELADPYLRDDKVAEAQIKEFYDHMLTDVTVSHIMLPLGSEALADSLLQVIKSGQTPYETVAEQFSRDRYSAGRGGWMGVVKAGRYPWPFEKASFELSEVGELSPVVNSGIGLHIIRLEKRQPAIGEVHAAHILLTTRNQPDSVEAAQGAKIDSLYKVVTTPGVDFGEIAKQYSQDPGSGSRGGDLGWFGPGMMVKEFDDMTFSLKDGEISKPFRTQFGWHIIYRIESRGVGSLDDNRTTITEALARDTERAGEARNAYLKDVIAKYKGSVNEKTMKYVAEAARKHGDKLDQSLIEEFAASKKPALTFNGKTTTLGELIAYVPSVTPEGPGAVENALRQAADNLLNSLALDQAREDLADTNPDYRNLINEYRDGILLFEISNRNVWERASTDTEGLENYFRQNRDKYRWEAPKFKSFIFFAPNDSLLDVAVKYATDSIAPSVKGTDVTAAMRDRFGRDVKVERVIAAKGENSITDYLGFGEPRPADANPRWSSYAAYRGRVIDQPEEAADVRGAVVADYQAALEREWLEGLHAKYPVKINRDVLKQVK
ncbi:MAG: peptidylprolyl isomerase [Bacteroidales bacterium]|nr:peptidylprolyl isomerase [Bacteroidales bacterium]